MHFIQPEFVGHDVRCIFDHDNDAVVNRVSVPEHPFKAWGNNVFSLAIPIPDHRKGESAICIESYYTDEQLRTTDIQGRRLYLSKEFNPVSGRHYGDPRLSVGNKSRLGRPDTVINRIIDAEVYDEKNANVALSKGSFAVNVLEAHDSFVNITFSAFQIIFDIISTIVADAAIKGSEQESVREAVFCWGRLNSEFANRQ